MWRVSVSTFARTSETVSIRISCCAISISVTIVLIFSANITWKKLLSKTSDKELNKLTWAAKLYFIIFTIGIVLIVFTLQSIFRIDQNNLSCRAIIRFWPDDTSLNRSSKITITYLISIFTIANSGFIFEIAWRTVSTRPTSPGTNFRTAAIYPVLKWKY